MGKKSYLCTADTNCMSRWQRKRQENRHCKQDNLHNKQDNRRKPNQSINYNIMRKHLFSILLCLLATMTVQARYGIDEVSFGGHALYLTNQNWTKNLADWDDNDEIWEHLSGTAKWDYATRSLTLTNVSVFRLKNPNSSAVKTGMWIEASQDINVIIKGECTVFSGSGCGLITYGNVALTGDGTLELTGSEACVKWGTSNTTLTVNGPDLTVTGNCSNTQMLGTNDKTCKLYVEKGSIKFEATSHGTPDAYAIAQLKSVSMAYGIDVKTPHGGFYSSTGYLCDPNGTPLKGKEAYIGQVESYGFFVNGWLVSEANYDMLAKRMKGSIKEGAISYKPSTNTLYLTGLKMETSSTKPLIENWTNDGLKIRIVGENILDYNNSAWFLYSRKNVSIMGENPGNAFGKPKLSQWSEGKGIYVSDGTLTMENIELWVDHIEGSNRSATLDIRDNVYLTARGTNDKNGTIRNVTFKKKVPLISDTNGACFIWNRTDGGVPGIYADHTYLFTKCVIIQTYESAANTKYKVRVGDVDIHSGNKNHFISDIITNGFMEWDDNTKTLIMHNVEISADATNIINIDENATIKLVGICKIAGTNTNESQRAIYANGKNITIDNEGTSTNTLTVTAKKDADIWAKGLTVNKSKLTVSSIKTDMLELNNCEVSVTRKFESLNNTATANIAVPVRLNGVIVESTEASPAYFNNENAKVISKNGSVHFVKDPGISQHYQGATFLACDIHSYNNNYLWTEQVESGTVRYDYADGHFVFNNAKIQNNTDKHVINFENKDGCIIVRGTNSIHCSKPESRSVNLKGSKLTILGLNESDNLVVSGTNSTTTNAGSIYVGLNSSVTMSASNMAHVTFPSLEGANVNGSNLNVYAPYLTFTGNRSGTVRNVTCPLSNQYNVELYSTSSSPREVGTNGILSDGVLCTGEVKYVRKGESYIPVENVYVYSSTGECTDFGAAVMTLTRKGATGQLTVTVSPFNATDRDVVWVSDNKNVATVDATGKVTAIGPGRTKVHAYPGGKVRDYTIEEFSNVVSNCCDVYVNLPEATGITLDREEFTFKDENMTAFFLRATLTPADANYDDIVWTSSDESIATVKPSSENHEGLVRCGSKDGTCTITAKIQSGYEELSASCKVTVRLHPTYVEEILFDVPDEIHMKSIGETFTITPNILPESATDKTIRWWSNTQDNVTVDQNGTVTAKNYGGSVVFCFAEDGSGVYKSIRVYVDRPPVLATGIEISPQFPNTFYAIGDQLPLSVTITPTYATNKTVRWESDDESVAIVDESGIVTITGWGSCHVTATTTDGSNLTSEPCYIDSQDPTTIWEPVPGYALSLDEKEVTFFRGEGKTVIINVSPANFNGHLYYEPLENWEVFNNVLPFVDVNYDANNTRYISVGTDPNMPRETGTVHIRVYIDNESDIDREKLRELGYPDDYVPEDTITVHVVDPVMFTAKSPEGIDVTYRVPSLDGDECEVYADYEEGRDWDPELLDYACTPAVSVNASGKLTIPSKVKNPSTGKEYWVTHVTTHAFMQCSKLTEIEFGEGITSIDRWACYRRMYGLTKVTLPSSIKELGLQCFAANANDYMQTGGYGDEEASGFSNLREVYIKAFTPPVGQESDIEYADAFSMIAPDAVLYVPIGAKENYNFYPWVSEWVEPEDPDDEGYTMYGWFSRIEEFDFGEGGDEDAIKDLKDSKDLNDLKGSESFWYTLGGQRVSKPTKPGLYIRNGQKVVIK